jgi:hypothetical protein
VHIALAAKLLPELRGQMGRKGCQQHYQGSQGLDEHRLAAALAETGQGIAELHQFSHRGIELIRIVEIVIDGGVTAGGLMRARGELQKTVAAKQKRTHTAKSRRP